MTDASAHRTSALTAPFAERWARARAQRGNLCLGVAPSTSRLADWGLSDRIDSARRMCDILCDVAARSVAAVKVQTVFFERFGPAGIELLAESTARWQAGGALVIADCKRGDASDTMGSIADIYLGRGSVMGADGMTASPTLGLRSLHPLFDAAHERGALVLVMVRTSGHIVEGPAARVDDGRTVSELLADGIQEWNRQRRQIGPVGAVISASAPEASSLLSRLGPAIVSLPGLGRRAQSVHEVVQVAAPQWENVLLPITSAVLGGGATGLPDRLARWSDLLAEAISAHSLV